LTSSATKPLRIAMISYYLPSGSKIGVGYQVHALANELVSRGHDVAVFSGCGPSDGAAYRTEQIDLRGSNRTFKFALKLRKVDWSAFDVLHAHGDDYWLWRQRVPAHVRTLHGSCFGEALRIKGARERLRMVLLGFSELLATVVADESVAVSNNTRAWMPWVNTVIPNGVDLTRFHPGKHSEKPSVLFVGTYRQRKRGRLLADVFQRDVLPVLPDARLWMVTDDAPETDGVTVFGRLSDEALADLYRSAWVFCLPSTYEGFGIPYVEAMASGCPVVATRNPGALEVTDCGRTGVVAEERDLGVTLTRLLASRSERDNLASAGLEWVSRYSLSTVATSYESLYRRLVAVKSCGEPEHPSADNRIQSVS
jgi:phosphatidyl-myo-inositol alpha-mannosyltransferase